MNQLNSSLLDSSFQEYFENTRNILLDYQQKLDEMQSFGESEIHVNDLQEITKLLKQTQIIAISVKEHILQLENISRGIEQKNKTKKLRDLYNQYQERQQKIAKDVMKDNKDERVLTILKQLSKILKLQSKNEIQNFTIVVQDNKKEFQQELQIHYNNDEFCGDHQQVLEWENIKLKQNQEDIERINQKSQGLQQLVQQLNIEVDSQGEHINIIETNVVETQVNVKKAEEQLEGTQQSQKKNTKLLICMVVCALITFIVVLVALLV